MRRLGFATSREDPALTADDQLRALPIPVLNLPEI
jgi:hypothetical protein